MNKRILYTVTAVIAILLGALHSSGAAVRTDADSVLISAVSIMDDGDYDTARAMLSSIISDIPGCDAAHYYLGICLASQGELDAAKECLREACRLDPSNYWYSDYLARLCAASGETEEASALYEGMLREHPDKTEVYFTLANLYSRQGLPDKVMATLDEIERVSGDSDMLAVARYETLRGQKKDEEAFAMLEKYNSRYASPQILSAMGDYKLSQYEDSLAIVYYDEALSYEPSFGPAMLGKTEAYRIGRKYPEFFAALDSYVTDPEIPSEMSSDYLKQLLQHSDPRFLQNFRTPLDSVMAHYTTRDPSDSTTLSVSGAYYYNTGRRDEALSLLGRNASLHGDNLGIRGEYIYALASAGRWEQVASQAEEAWQQWPEQYSLLSMKATAYFNLGEYQSFIHESERIVEVAAPSDTVALVSAYSGMGDVYHLMGEQKKAFKAYDKALRYNPTYAPVLNNYAYYLSESGRKLGKAYSMSKITVEAEPDNATYLDTFAWILHLQGKDVEAKPFFKHAMLYGGKDSAVMLDHYAEVLWALGEHDLAKVYWNLAKSKNTNGEVPDLEERSSRRMSGKGR